MRNIPYVDLQGQYASQRDVLLPVIEAALSTGLWVGGPQIERFEEAFAAYCGARFAIGVGSGTDALILSLRALDVGPGDEVITVPNSFVASAACIYLVGAKPVFVDVAPDQNIDVTKIERAITPRTKAILPVHLTGRVAAMDSVMTIADRHGLKVIEDAAQAVGSKLKDRSAGLWGHAGCFSAHPLKNLNAMGDGGIVITDDDAIAARLRRLRNNGLVDRNTVAEWGTVSRLDTVQAAILLERLKRLDEVTVIRRANAARYMNALDRKFVFFPPELPDQFNTYHTFVVQVNRRDELQQFLSKNGIGTAIHYPIPIHLQPAAKALGYKLGDFPRTEEQAARILTLPVHQLLKANDIDYVADKVNAFFHQTTT